MTTTTEFWLTYHQVSRVHKPATAQLVELEFQDHKLSDLEDVLEHVFRQGFVEPKYRPLSWWERKNGVKVKGSHVVEDLLKEGVGSCPDTALKLVIADIPNALWFSYIHLHRPSENPVVQRIKTDTVEFRFEKLAHLTNHIFGQGYLAPGLRCLVHWERSCGKDIPEDFSIIELLESGEGACEGKPIRLVIDHHPVHEHRICHPVHEHPICHPAPEHHGHHEHHSAYHHHCHKSCH